MKKRILAVLLGLGMLTGAVNVMAENETIDFVTEEAEVSEEAGTVVRVGSLKGPTSMGLVSLMNQGTAETEDLEEIPVEDAGNTYEFTMAAAADEINAAFIKGDLDIVLIPANVASVLYNKTEGQVAVIDINTLGVLYILENGETVQSVADLAGKTIYLPGKGTSPDYVLQYLLAQNGLTTEDVTLEYKSEGAEVIAAIGEDPEAIALLPQPAATTACIQNEGLHVALNLTEEWTKVNEKSRLLTGVTVVRKAFLEENAAAVDKFLEDHKEAAAFTNENVEAASEIIAALEIVPKAPIAAKAIPLCNITCITGEEMKDYISGYLEVLAEMDPQTIGGTVPGEDFYYIAE